MKTVLRRGRALAALGVTGALAASLVVAVPTVAQAVASVGFSGQVQLQVNGTLSSLPLAPTATKTQHKVWYASGTWWAAMQNQGSTGTSIHRLDGRETGTPSWTDTNVVIDSRSGTSSDSFYNGSANKLFVATHVLTERNTTSLPTTVGDDNDAKLMRYSLVDGAWVLDEGFPVTIVGRGLSSLAIAQLTDGKVMATYTYNRRPYATNTTGTANGVSAPTFVNPFVVQWTKNTLLEPDVLGSTTLTGDDVSAITAADGFVTIMFSNQSVGHEGYYVARHRVGDSFGTGNFFGTRLTSGADSADNHLALVTDPTSGLTSAVYAVVKTSLDDTVEPDGVTPRVPNPADPLLRVFKLQPRSGGTALTTQNAGYVDLAENTTVTTVAEGGTRPVISLDNSRRKVDVFYAVPDDPSLNTNVIGVIEHASVPLSGAFVASASDVVMANSANTAGATTSKPDGMSDPTVSAQIVNQTYGTMVLATDTTVANLNANPLSITRRYWFNDLFRAPIAAFTATIPDEVGNEDGLTVDFTDTSLGKPESWAWNFGPGEGTSTSENPSHTFATAGTKTITLEVDNGFSTDSVVKTVVVGQAPAARFTYKFPDRHRLLLELTDVSTGAPQTAVWDFGDKTSRTVNYPASSTVVRHAYAKPGKYRIKLTVTNGVGSNWTAHPTTKPVSVYYFVVNATPNKVAKPTRTALAGKKAVVAWKAPNPRGLTITKYQAICRSGSSVKSTVVSAKDFTSQIGRTRTATVSALTAGKSYTCTVKAYNAKGWNLPSAPSTAFTARA